VSHFTALYDACVLYPAQLRSLLMYLALTDLFRAKWTDAIHEEWMRNVLTDHPDMSLAQVERIRDLMNANVRDCLVTGYEDLIPALQLPDPDDRHVLAAGIRGRVDVIVTSNLKDFPTDTLNPLGIEVLHPDEFVTRLLDLDAGAVCLAVKRQRESLKKPPKTIDELLATFEQCGLPQTVARLKEFAALL
jgi:predicted nucleic acid-binding protein